MVSQDAKNLAIDILLKLSKLNYMPDKVMESAEGGIGFVWLRTGKQADIEIFNDGSIFGAVYPKKSETVVFQVSVEDLTKAVDIIKMFILGNPLTY
jgi:hypothetical protein